MNRIDKMFEEKRVAGKTAFIPYVTAGYPDLKTTEALIPALEKSGADLLELGVPFSDPIADGPTIQKASTLALENGATLSKILSLAKSVRKKVKMPILLFSAYNPFVRYGLERLVKRCRNAGIDGLLIPDLPPEEADDLISLCRDADLRLVFLIAPTTTSERTRLIAEKSSGFIYYVSTRGVTGARKSLPKDVAKHLTEIREFTDKPVAVGFGISRPEHVVSLKDKADGIIVGSAIIRKIESGKNVKERVRLVSGFVKSLTSVLD